jgi:hypothetical protein
MDLLTLNLHRPLRWDARQASDAGIGTVLQAIAAALTAPEDAEIVLVWDWNAIIDDASGDGPRTRVPIVAPSLIAAANLLPPSAAMATGQTGGMELDTGRYLFVQTRPSGAPETAVAELPGLFEWFAREAWWSQSVCDGPLVLRLVHEDKDTALQLIRHLSDPVPA